MSRTLEQALLALLVMLSLHPAGATGESASHHGPPLATFEVRPR